MCSLLVNSAVPETIDERVINWGKNLSVYQATENNNLAIGSAAAIGCSVVNMGAQDIWEQKEHIILGLVWSPQSLLLLSSSGRSSALVSCPR